MRPFDGQDWLLIQRQAAGQMLASKMRCGRNLRPILILGRRGGTGRDVLSAAVVALFILILLPGVFFSSMAEAASLSASLSAS
ncbi:hypothetical protein LZ31DRAFT_285148 [Colletotrichum somersetense]|nr:hypothetical protein LZ31DRAFT_285148 [Colletotrichum somersetense]